MPAPRLASRCRIAAARLPARQNSIIRSENGRACSVAPVSRLTDLAGAETDREVLALIDNARDARTYDNRQADIERLANEDEIRRILLPLRQYRTPLSLRRHAHGCDGRNSSEPRRHRQA